MEPWYKIDLMGRLWIVPLRRKPSDSAPLTQFQRRSSGALLAYLAYYPEEHPRADLIDLLWPTTDAAHGKSNLTTALAELRRILTSHDGVSECIVSNHSVVQLENVTTDIAEFSSALKATRSACTDEERAQLLTVAIQLYRGDLVPDRYAECFAHAPQQSMLAVDNSEEDEPRPRKRADWINTERAKLTAIYREALRKLIYTRERLYQLEPALDAARLLVDSDPISEEAAYCLIRLLAILGRSEEAWGIFQELNVRLHQTSCLLSETTRRLVRQMLAGGQDLPRYRNRFFGREDEMARMRHLLVEDSQSGSAHCGTRLVTLTGPAGSGKTRLAVEMAQHVADDFRGRIWFVPCAEIANISDEQIANPVPAEQIVTAVCNAMSLESPPHQSSVFPETDVLSDKRARIAKALAKGPSLLILDNFEGLATIGGDSFIWPLLEGSPSLRLLVTSRRSLIVPGEREIVLPPLPTPLADIGEVTSEAAPSVMSIISAEPSVQLFVDRALAADTEFRLREDNAVIVADLCRRLDGLPLALELAAARVRTFSVNQILNQLIQVVPLNDPDIGTGQADGPPGDSVQRQLWATIEWSFRLLFPALRQFLTRLSIFQGGWSLEAARAVCDDASPESAPTIDYLALLRIHSLIVAQEANGELRYRMLESVRSYAALKLADEREENEGSALARRHAGYYMGMVEQSWPKITGPDQPLYLDLLEQDHDNIRAALRWASKHDLEVFIRLAASLWLMWQVRGHVSEGRTWLRQALIQFEVVGGTSIPRKVLMTAYTAAGNLAYHQGDYAAMTACYETSRNIAEALDSPADISTAMNNLGLVAWEQARYNDARICFERSLEIDRTLNDSYGIALVLGNLGGVAIDEGDYDTAARLYAESLELAGEISSGRPSAACALNGLGLVALQSQHYSRARECFEQSLCIRREAGNLRSIAITTHNLGLVEQREGEIEAAATHLVEALKIRGKLDDWRGVAESLEAFAGLAIVQNQFTRSARLLGAAKALRYAIGAPLPLSDQSEQKCEIQILRSNLKPAEFVSAWRDGRGLTFERGIALALAPFVT